MNSLFDDPSLEFVRECVLLGRRWRVKLDERLKASGMTMARATVLFWVGELPDGATQRDLAELVGIEGPTLVRLLHALEEQGLIERVANTSDRRAKGIRLTEAARPVLDEISRASADLSAERLGKLERRRLPSAIRLAKEARAALD